MADVNMLSASNFMGVLGAAEGSTLQVALSGVDNLGFRLDVPTGGAVAFEGSWDGVTWAPVSVRCLSSAGYRSVVTESANCIAIVTSFVYFRWRTAVAGTEDGYAYGRLATYPSSVEGAEHQFMLNQALALSSSPTQVSREFTFNGSTTDSVIWELVDVAHRISVADIQCAVTATTDTTITFSDGSIADGKPICTMAFKNSQSLAFLPVFFALPHAFSGTNRPLMFSQTGNAKVEGVVHGYATTI